MKKEIQQLITELYQIDPKFKKYEKELIKAIEKILASKPDTKIDKIFVRNLRAQLLNQAQKKNNAKNPQTSPFNSLIEIITMKKFAYVAGGVVLTVLILIPVIALINQSKIAPAFIGGSKITRLKDNAFGSLSEQQAQLGQQDARGLAVAQEAASPVVGIGASAPKTQGGGGGGGMAASEAMMIMPPYYQVNYRYVYKGEPIVLDQEKLAVLRRIRNSGNNFQVAGLISSFNLGLADLSGFANSKIQNLSFVQNTPYGYIININLDEGAVTIFNNWQTWPQPQCNDEICWQQQRLKIGDVPSDQETIKIAGDFLKKIKIDTTKYGQPFVDNNWRLYYEQTLSKEEFYVPDTLNVIYPLKIDGKGVYEGHGYPVGINVSVSIKEKKVTAVTNLFTQNYQSSMYQAETNIDRIMKLVEIGGIYSYPTFGADKTYEIELGQAELGYFRKFNYKDGQNEELLIPALIFPVVSQPEFDSTAGQFAPYFNKQYVVVPLIKEVLDEFDQQQEPPVRIMPLTEPAPAVEPEIIKDLPAPAIEE